MNPIGIVLVLAAAAASIGGYVQERARLVRLEQMPAEDALRFYETVRRRQERRLTVVVVALGLGAVAALVFLLLDRA